MSTALIDGSTAALFFGTFFGLVACVFGLLLPVLWPTKDHSKANQLLTGFWWMGLVCIVVGVIAFLVGVLA
jgi:hypothetical protein